MPRIVGVSRRGVSPQEGVLFSSWVSRAIIAQLLCKALCSRVPVCAMTIRRGAAAQRWDEKEAGIRKQRNKESRNGARTLGAARCRRDGQIGTLGICEVMRGASPRSREEDSLRKRESIRLRWYWACLPPCQRGTPLARILTGGAAGWWHCGALDSILQGWLQM